VDAKNVVTKLKAEAAIQEKELAEKQKEANDALIMIKVIKLVCKNFKVEKILKASLDLIPSPSPSVKIQIMDRKVCLRYKAKHNWASPSNVLPYYTSSRLSRQLFEFSLKVKASNPGYLLESFLL
jgi:hypothetical protein